MASEYHAGRASARTPGKRLDRRKRRIVNKKVSVLSFMPIRRADIAKKAVLGAIERPLRMVMLSAHHG
jgi:hypothetical protein